MFPPFKVSRSTAFSLVEILVALVILAALALVGSAVIGSSRQKAENMRCVAYLRQAGVSVMASIAERNQVLKTFAGGAPEKKIWGRQVVTSQKDVHQRVYLRCPVGPAGYAIDNVNWYWSTYGINVSDTRYGALTTGDQPGESLYRLPVMQVENPASFVLIADSGGPSKNANGDRNQIFRLHNSAAYRAGVVARHAGSANIFFLDGHLEAVPRDRLGDYFIPYYDQADTFHAATP